MTAGDTFQTLAADIFCTLPVIPVTLTEAINPSDLLLIKQVLV